MKLFGVSLDITIFFIKLRLVQRRKFYPTKKRRISLFNFFFFFIEINLVDFINIKIKIIIIINLKFN